MLCNKMDYKQMTTKQLRRLLSDDCDGIHELDTDTILTICDILANRHPPAKSAEESWKSFTTHYLDGE